LQRGRERLRERDREREKESERKRERERERERERGYFEGSQAEWASSSLRWDCLPSQILLH
jgi:hypothetical protein